MSLDPEVWLGVRTRLPHFGQSGSVKPWRGMNLDPVAWRGGVRSRLLHFDQSAVRAAVCGGNVNLFTTILPPQREFLDVCEMCARGEGRRLVGRLV